MAPIAEKYAKKKKKRYSIVTLTWIIKNSGYAKNPQWWLPLSNENHWASEAKSWL